MKKFFTLLAALTASLGLWAIDGVKYIDAYGQEQIANNVTEITEENFWPVLSSGWYVVYETNFRTRILICNGSVHLILADNAKITANEDGFYENPGIQVTGGNSSLTVYAQSTDPNKMGQIYAKGSECCAGIGGQHNIGDGADITINGGNITAIGGDYGAGIGGGCVCRGVNITINGGIVNATGGYASAGIGGGRDGTGCNITINGGNVTAIGADGAAGIGGGFHNPGTDITINGGVVRAEGGSAGAGIGGGQGGGASNIRINGGELVVKGDYAPAIGSCASEPASDIYVSSILVIKSGDEIISPDHTTTTDIASDLSGIRYLSIEVSIPAAKAEAIAAIEAARQGIQDAELNANINQVIIAINQASSAERIADLKSHILSAINVFQRGKGEGYEVGYQEGYVAGAADTYTAPTEPGMRMVVTKKAEGTNPAKVYEFDTRDIESVEYREVTE